MSGRTQLPLGLRLPAASRLDNFVAGANREAVAAVAQLVRTQAHAALFLSGPPGSGKTHLLQAACRLMDEQGGQGAYLPLAALGSLAPEALTGLDQFGLVALDDIDAIAGRADWEEAVFHLYNRLHGAGGRLLAAAAAPPEHLRIALPDLRSRLAWGGVYALQLPDDGLRLRILGVRARERGLDLPDEVAQFLLRRCPRDIPELMRLLERIDHAALAAQRRLTVPFVKSVLEGRAG